MRFYAKLDTLNPKIFTDQAPVRVSALQFHLSTQ